jgi:ADP-ribose pyrophosphatase YjhB (NUDIX family)
VKFCSHCGQAVVYKTPAGDNRPRYCCEACGSIHYENPRLVVGTLPVFQSKILLCKRAIEPRYGFWTLPAGFMENGESIAAGALRETIEEAGAQIEIGALFSVQDVPHVNQVHVYYLAQMRSAALDPGEETLEARLFDESEIPWDELAFPTVKNTLRWYFEDLHKGALPKIVAATLDGPNLGGSTLGPPTGATLEAFTPHQKVLIAPMRKA